MALTRLVLVTVLSLAFTPVASQDWGKASTAYENGEFSVAFQEWLPLAVQGEGGPQAMIGLMYQQGLGVPRDYTKAIRWLKLASEQGLSLAQNKLGVMYMNGQGVLQDYTLAVKWFRSAAVQGEANGQNNLAVMYEGGLGLIQDNVTAHMWYNIASANGYEKSSVWREQLAAKMTNADISKAQAKARECMASGYAKCGY